jgi:hypothetical protein
MPDLNCPDCGFVLSVVDDLTVCYRCDSNEWESMYRKESTERLRLQALIDTPHTTDFLSAVPLEAAHQIKRWGVEQDDGKQPTDWLWLVGYLIGKATNSAISGNTEKAKHHCVSTAAVCLNWFRRLSGEDQSFRPGIQPPAQTAAGKGN